MLRIITVIILIHSSLVYAKLDCVKNPIYCQILKNKKNINKKYALELSNIIYKVSKQYNFPAKIYTAILMQESTYNIKAQNCKRGMLFLDKNDIRDEYRKCRVQRDSTYWAYLMKYKKVPARVERVLDKRVIACKNRVDRYMEVEVCFDFGISQINYVNVKYYKLSIHKLRNDLEYSVKAGAVILDYFYKKFNKKDPDWWTRYNCGERGSTKRQTCRVYKRKVSRFL